VTAEWLKNKDLDMTFNNFSSGLRRWWGVQKAIRTLNQLDDSELNDLDIGRWRIPLLAQQSVK